jgi:hypothetical protein
MWVKYYDPDNPERTKKFNLSKDAVIPDRLNKMDEDGVVWYRSNLEEPKKGKLLGHAVLTKDDITGMNLWSTHNAEGEKTNLSPMQALVMPTTMQIGIRVEIYAPGE